MLPDQVCNMLSHCESLSRKGGGGGALAQSVERATPGEEIPGSIPAVAARSPTD